MVVCKKCGYKTEYSNSLCSMCQEKFEFSENEYNQYIAIYDKALKELDYIAAAEALNILADGGYKKYRRIYAGMLEQGRSIDQNIERAMRYYLAGAYENDGYSAYRYSVLLKRYTKDDSKFFWLCYAALLGETEAYEPASEYLFSISDNKAGMYFLRKYAEDTSNNEAILQLVKRYASGIGTPKSDGFAKWYIEKLKFPPINALKTVFSLRNAEAKRPPEISVSDIIPLIERLYKAAEKYGYKPMRYYLCERLAENGDNSYKLELCALKYNGEGTARDKEGAEKILIALSDSGMAESNLYLGEIYLSEENKKNIKTAVEYFIKAGHSGLSIGYETAADILAEGKGIERDIERAVELYTLGADMGDLDCRSKRDKYIGERAEIYEKAVLENNVTESFRLIAISAAMGYTKAIIALAKCYEEGIGVKKDRSTSFYWYKRAAKYGDADALYELGRAYSIGLGTKYDFKSAVSCFKKAEQEGNKNAKEALKRLYERKKKHVLNTLYSRGAELLYNKKYIAAYECLDFCAKQGHMRASYLLGCMYEFALLGRTELDKAKEHYMLAHALGFFDTGSKYKKQILKIIR